MSGAFVLDDLDGFLSTEDFGSAATLTCGTGKNAVTTLINVIFDDGFRAVENLESAAPQAHCKASDVAAAAHGDTLQVGGATYTIRGIQPDGTGMTVLILSED